MRTFLSVVVLAELAACSTGPPATPCNAQGYKVSPAAGAVGHTALAEPCVGPADCLALAEAKSPAAATDFRHVADLYERACAAGSGRGCSVLSGLYCSGAQGAIPVDYARCQALAERACALEPDGCFDLANLYLQGRPGIQQDRRRAFELFRNTCRTGHDLACKVLSDCYAQGWGVGKDAARARQYLWMAEQLGYVGD
jgi:TPR repeat protein